MESVKIVEGQRKTILRNEEIELFKQSFVIVPYQIGGFIDYTNKGASNEVINPNDFETFKRIWTGNDACVLNWKNSISLNQNKETKELEVNFQLGEVFLGALELNNNDNNIITDTSFSDYKAQEIESRLTFRVHKFFNITDYYQLLFYKIPELSGSTLYRIESIEKDYAGRELLGYVITFKSVNQELSNTGRARQQNIMPNSPGQGYLECKVEDSTWPDRIGKENFDKLENGRDYYYWFGRYIIADYQKVLNRPARKAVVKLFGANILLSFSCIGRPVLSGDKFTKFREQRLIFPYKFKSASTPNLVNTQNETTNFYFGEFIPTLEYFKDLMTSIKDSLTPVNKWSYQGWLLYNYQELKNTNPIESGVFKYELFGWLDNSSQKIVQRDWIFETKKQKIETNGVYGVEQVYEVGGEKAIWDHLFDNFWTQKQLKVLPLEVKNTLTFGWTLATSLLFAKQGGLAGWTASILLSGIGIPATLIGKLIPKTIKGVRGIINASLIDYNNSLFKITDTNKNKLPFNILNSNIENDLPNEIFFRGSTINTSFEANLTDLFISERVKNSDGSYKTLSTLNIGQVAFENGENILPTGTEFKLNGDAKLLETFDNYSGYIIDSFKIGAIHNGDISVEFLDNNNEIIWSGVYQSEGKWTGSMREIWTEKNCSVFGRENVFFTEPTPYPKPISPPSPSFPVGIKKEVRNNDLFLKVLYKIPGGGTTFTNPSGIPNTLTKSIRKPKDVEIILLENVSKDELLQVYDNITIFGFNNDDSDNKIIKQISVFELFSLPNYKLEYDGNFGWNGRYNIPATVPPGFFPTETANVDLKYNFRTKTELYFKDNKLIFKNTITNITNDEYWFTSPERGYKILFRQTDINKSTGISKIAINPKN